MKNCADCGPLDESEFGRNSSSPDGLNYYCKVCARKRRAKYRQKALRDPNRVQRMQEHRTSWVSKNPSYDSDRKRAQRRQLRAEMLAAYGNKCSCCGEKEEPFLTLEHINRDGASHKRKVGGDGLRLFLDLKRRGWPTDAYTVYCMNCNWATRRGDVCPHKQVPERK